MRLALIVMAIVSFVGTVSHANLIINGDFETGDLTGWTTFTTASATATGSLGASTVVLFDTNGDSNTSLAAQFQVGQVSPGTIGGGSPLEGGGIFQDVNLLAGDLTVSVDVAASSSGNNAAGGLFELIFDGNVVDFFDIGDIGAGTVERGSLLFQAPNVVAGTHEVRIRMTRGFGTGSSTPRQYIDNVSLLGTPIATPTVIPEPLSIFQGLIGLATVSFFVRRRSVKFTR